MNTILKAAVGMYAAYMIATVSYRLGYHQAQLESKGEG